MKVFSWHTNINITLKAGLPTGVDKGCSLY